MCFSIFPTELTGLFVIKCVKVLLHYKRNTCDKDFPGGPVAKTPCSQCRGPGFEPCSGTRSHILQPKITSATAKTWHSQINKWILKKRNTCDSTIESFTFKSHFTFNWERNCLMSCYQKVNTTFYLWNTQPLYSNLINMNLMNQIF